jgi:hypothetical protein
MDGTYGGPSSQQQTVEGSYGAPSPQLGHVFGTREALNGCRYSQAQFQQHYGDGWESYWDARAHTSDAPQFPVAASLPHEAEAAASDASQVTVATTVRLCATSVIAVRAEEAARGPPRSLHGLARHALNNIYNNTDYDSVNLDGYFPWPQYVAAHAQSTEIIGPGITHASAVFVTGTRDHNRGGCPRLDFFFYRTDGTVCRVHPGYKRKTDAKLFFENHYQEDQELPSP